MTIYQMYRENGNCADFWVQHRAWRNICGKVRCIGGQLTAPLPETTPKHNAITFLIEGYDVLSGRRTPLAITSNQPADKNYRRIADPPWSRR